MNRLSKIFCPADSTLLKTKAASVSKNQILLTDLGLMKPLDKGTYFYLPLLQKSLNKASELIKRYMHKLDAQQITIPNLTSVDLWKESGRYADFESELFTAKDRKNNSLVLGPTFEEAITKLAASGHAIGQQQLPLRLYQIGNKFRDEAAPRYGLIRSREFLMKDLYTFDADKDSALKTYNEVNDVYAKLFKYIGVPFVKVESDASEMGGHLSHEYHFMAPIGDEKLSICSKCRHAKKCDAIISESNTCPKCNESSVNQQHGIEIGHTFYLGDTYSKLQRAHFMKDSKPLPMQMGCYGIGVTRLVGAAIESLSTEKEIRWPFALAPFSVCIIPPEKRSKVYQLATHHLDVLYNRLNDVIGSDDSIIVDDRIKLSIGHRLIDTKKLGFPLIIIIGKKAIDPGNELFELHFTQTNKIQELPLPDLIQTILDFVRSQSDQH